MWAVEAPDRLGPSATAVVAGPGNQLVIGAGAVWEIAIEIGLGKLRLSRPYAPWFPDALSNLGAAMLPIDVAHAEVVASLPFHHRDPFDRLLVAQARVENLAIVSVDSILDAYGVSRIW